MWHPVAEANAMFLKGGVQVRSTRKKGGLALGLVLTRLHRGPKEGAGGGLQTPPPQISTCVGLSFANWRYTVHWELTHGVVRPNHEVYYKSKRFPCTYRVVVVEVIGIENVRNASTQTFPFLVDFSEWSE